MEDTCPCCGEEKELTADVFVHDSDVFGHPPEKGISDLDVDFPVSFPGNDGYTSITLCAECYNSNEYLTADAKARIQ